MPLAVRAGEVALSRGVVREPGELTILPPPLHGATLPLRAGIHRESLRVVTARVLAVEAAAAFEHGDARRHGCALRALLELVTCTASTS